MEKYKDVSLPTRERAEDLMGRMRLEGKTLERFKKSSTNGYRSWKLPPPFS